MNWILYIVIGLVAGWLAGLVVKGRGSGFWVNIIVGIIGGVIGGWLFSLMGYGEGGNWLWSLATATLGAIVLLLIVGLFTRKHLTEE